MTFKLVGADENGVFPPRVEAHIAALISAGGGSSAATTQLLKTQTGPLRGVNVAGAEFGTLGDAFDTSWGHESAASFNYLASRGHRLIRYPFMWERLQPTKSAAFNSAEQARLVAVVAAVKAAGMQIILDVHNYGRFNNVAFGAAGGPVQADFVDLWTRLSDLFADDPTVIGYSLMNEPHDLPDEPGTFNSAITHYSWDSTVQGWSGETVAVSSTQTHDGANSMSVTHTFTAGGFQLARVSDNNGTTHDETANGLTYAVWVWCPAGETGWEARIDIQDAGFANISGQTTSLTPNAWTLCKSTFTSGQLSTMKAKAIQIQSNSPTAGAKTFYVDTFQQGTIVGAESGVDRWKTYSQAVVTALRARGDSTCIMVGGYSWSSLPGWQGSTTEPWVVDPIDNFRYEAHHYWDTGGVGTYPNSYATETTNNASWGGTDPTEKKALFELRSWINWLSFYDVKGFIGELGWIRSDTGSNAADSSLWDDLGNKYYQMAEEAGDRLWLTYWATGSRWSPTYNLDAYQHTGSTLNATNSQALVIEKYRSQTPRIETPTTQVKFSDYMTSATWWRGSSYDPVIMNGVSAPVLGQPTVSLIKLEEDGPLSNLIVYVGTSITTPTSGQCFAALFDDRGNQLAVSGDIGSSLTATAYRSLAMTTPTGYKQAGQYVYGVLLVNAATACQIGRAAQPSGAIHARRFGLSGGTGQTAMPSSISPGSLTVAGAPFWMGVS